MTDLLTATAEIKSRRALSDITEAISNARKQHRARRDLYVQAKALRTEAMRGDREREKQAAETRATLEARTAAVQSNKIHVEGYDRRKNASVSDPVELPLLERVAA
jgi:hypothetical protein